MTDVTIPTHPPRPVRWLPKPGATIATAISAAVLATASLVAIAPAPAQAADCGEPTYSYPVPGRQIPIPHVSGETFSCVLARTTLTTTTPHEKRLIEGSATVIVDGSAGSNKRAMWSLGLSCATGDAAYSRTISHTTNAHTYYPMTQWPSLLMEFPTPGEWTCSLVSTTAGIHNIDPDDHLVVQPGGGFQASSSLESWSDTSLVDPVETSVLVPAGSTVARSRITFDRGSLTSFTVVGDVKLTACTAVGGSRDETTGGEYLCLPEHVDPQGTDLTSWVEVTQFEAGGGSPCPGVAPTRVDQQATHISKNIHHRTVTHAGTITPSQSPLCDDRFSVKIVVQVDSGARLVVHGPNTMTAATAEI